MSWRRPQRPWVRTSLVVAAVVALAVALAWSLNADGANVIKPSGPTPVAGPHQRQALHSVALSDPVGYSAVWVDTDGVVRAAAPDGAGGWFIGGGFSRVAGSRRVGLAHVRADGTLDPSWAPEVEAPARDDWGCSQWSCSGVHALQVVDDTVFVGGDFTGIGDRRRRGLAALDARTGRVRAWNPRMDGSVWALAETSGQLYAGGRFTHVGRASRRRLASFNVRTGALTRWKPAITGRVHYGPPEVYTLLVDGKRLYVGGLFRAVDGRYRGSAAAFVTATGTLTSWTPRTYDVKALAVAGDTVYLGGTFTSVYEGPDDVFGAENISLAALDARSGALLPLQIDAEHERRSPNDVQALAVIGDRLFVGGDFTHLAGTPRADLGVLDTKTGHTIDWDPRAGKTVHVIAAAGNRVFVGGEFKALSG